MCCGQQCSNSKLSQAQQLWYKRAFSDKTYIVVVCCAVCAWGADLQLCGVLLNKVGSAGHGVWLTQALTAAWEQQRLKKQVQVLGCIPKVTNWQQQREPKAYTQHTLHRG